jgi:hypothetical protein
MLLASLCACSNDHRSVPATPTTPTPIAETPPVAPARVQGLVLDFQTARPIAGAVVAFATADFSIEEAVGMTETAVSDANGRYSLPEPPPLANGQPYRFIVDNRQVGRGYPRATNYRADLAVDRGQCIARYGMVLDSRTFAPIVGATARNLSTQVRAVTDSQGWYHIDWGCGVGSIGFNTTWHVMSHPDYNPSNFASGRGISGNLREDVLLVPK